MKKIITVVVTGIGIAAAYPAAAWFSGKQVEEAQDQLYQTLADYQNVARIVKRDYQRGVFNSTETITLEMFADQGSPGLPLTFRSEIHHGPFPQFSTFGAGTLNTELVIDEKMEKFVTKLFGDKKPLLIHSKYYYGGGGEFTVESPDFSADTEGSLLNWGGFHFSGSFDKRSGHYVLQGGAPSFDAHDRSGAKAKLSGFKFAIDTKRIFDDVPELSAGSWKWSLAELDMVLGNEQKLVKQLDFALTNQVNGEFMDTALNWGAEVIRIDGVDYGPANVDASINHLHAYSFAKMYEAAKAMQEGTGDHAAKLASFKELLGELFKHDPEVRLNHLTFNSSQGAGQMNAKVRFIGVTPDELKDKEKLFASDKFEFDVEMSLPEALAVSFYSKILPGAGLIGEEELFAQSERDRSAFAEVIARDYLEKLISQGFAVRDGNMIKTEISSSKSQLIMNGKSFSPSTQSPATETAEEAPEAR